MTSIRNTLLLTAALMPLTALATTVRVHYDAGKDGITIRSDKGPMSWDKGAAASAGVDKVWSYTWPDSLGEITMKPALGADKVSTGGAYKLAAGATLDIYPFFGAPFGKVSIIPAFSSPQLQNTRALRVYLPPSYQENAAKRYPVLYMHDGQNLFDAKSAAYGVEWNVDETVNRLIAPDSGRVAVFGEDGTAVPAPELRRRIGYVFQEVGLFPHLTVAENIAVTPKLLGWDAVRRSARVAELLDLVALPPDVASRPPAALSGGQRQRVGIARALAAEPKLMLLDEPFGALDPVTRDALGADYRALHERLSLTTLMVTHDMAEAVLLADRVVVLKAGRILADGPPADLLARATDPDVRALLEAPKRQAERLRERLGA